MAVHTQVAIDEFAVVHLPPHGTDLLEFGFLTFHSFPQPLELLTLRHGLALTWVLVLQIPQSLLLNTGRGGKRRKGQERRGEDNSQFRNGREHAPQIIKTSTSPINKSPFTHLTTHSGELREWDGNNKDGAGKMVK